MDKIIAEKLICFSKKFGAERSEIYISSSKELSISVRDQEREELINSDHKNIGLRVIMPGNKQAIVSTTNIDDESLENLAKKACEVGNFSITDPFITYKDAIKFGELQDLQLDDHSTTDLNAISTSLEDYAMAIEDAAREHPNVNNSRTCCASASRIETSISFSCGFHGKKTSSLYRAYIVAIAKLNDQRESWCEYSISRDLKSLQDPRIVGRDAAAYAAKLLGSRKIKSAQLPVIFDRRVASEILSYFSSAINGSAIANKTSFLKDSLQQKLFHESVQIVDDPLIEKGLSSRNYDDEGSISQTKSIVENGIINSWILDLYTAKKLGLNSTANGLRSTDSAPTPSVTNFYLKNGAFSLEDMIKSIDYGIYVLKDSGGSSNLVSGDVSFGVQGLLIEKGQLTTPISEVTCAGNLKEIYKNMIPANDLTFQSSVNSPSIFVDKMILAGL